MLRTTPDALLVDNEAKVEERSAALAIKYCSTVTPAAMCCAAERICVVSPRAIEAGRPACSTAMRRVFGAISRRSWIHFAAIP